MSESAGGTGFAELLRELKNRSGHSYGMLAKRLHMSTSTLHRYCNGDAVPTDYAPVERMARLCGATPAELVALHRSWVLADARRGQKSAAGDGVTAEVAKAEVTEEVSGIGEAGTEEGAGASAEGAGPRSAPAAGPAPEQAPGSVAEPAGGPEPEPVPPAPRARRRRPALLAAVAGAAVLGAVAVALVVPGGDQDNDGKGADPAAVAASDRAPATGAGPSRPRGSRSPSASASARHPSASATPGNADGPDAATSAPPDTSGQAPASAAPLTVTTHPYSWESPCSQHYLINRPPEDVNPPPSENGAPAWVAVHQAVSAGEQFVTLTVQGSGRDTVVLEGLSVRMAGKRAPLAWNDYAMGYPGVGCGAGVPTNSFTVALDAVRPAVQPVAGQRGFPFSVSESDPEVFYITADASAYDVSWYLELSWSSGGRHGTLEIGDKGRPFRTSGNNGRPAYAFPLGGEKWAPAQQ
ncbi:helix-turn-helix domain-containing protein [Streptomyces sp. NEAU-sy36]|uniref:transcriptional regulator n=1 Tax=unclassified Streptomyces TaxID=2593676 RepID=UPI0015D65831|nr:MULTISPECIES: transcriptional regulator [unclassified Streptomyces]QLJ05599.1 helix-turn-helix domain-containing protein [Streptomyces sp. NEAU-sy36]